MERYEIVVEMDDAHMRPHPTGQWLNYADAQAQIDAKSTIILQMGEQAAGLAKENIDLKAQLEAVRRERDGAVRQNELRRQLIVEQCEEEERCRKLVEKWDASDSYGVEYISDVVGRIIAELTTVQAALDAEREKRTALLAEIDEGLTLSDNLLAIQTVAALYDKLAQLQMLVRALPVVEGPINDEVMLDLWESDAITFEALWGLLTYRATLDAAPVSHEQIKEQVFTQWDEALRKIADREGGDGE